MSLGKKSDFITNDYKLGFISANNKSTRLTYFFQEKYLQ